jgi:hypothetical protein
MSPSAPATEAGDGDGEPSPDAVVIPLAGRRPQRAAGAGYHVHSTDGALALKRAAPHEDHPESATSQPTGAARTATIVARALLEVLSGWRPPSQLSRWTSYALQQDLERRAPRRPTGIRLQLLRVRVSEPAVGVAEVCALAQDPNRKRVRVLALRMEQREGSWVVTRLQAG